MSRETGIVWALIVIMIGIFMITLRCAEAGIVDDAVQEMIDAGIQVHEAEYHGEEPPEPPPPPIPPPPPAPGEPGLIGGEDLTDCWSGWVGRHGMDEKFGCGPGYGWMGTNTNAGVKMPGKGNTGWWKGWFEIEFWYEQEEPAAIGWGGGQHLVGIFSQSAKRTGPYDPSLDYELGDGNPLEGAVRLDFDVKRDGKINLVLFESGPRREKRIGTLHGYGAVHTWHKIRVEWAQTEEEIRFVVNGTPIVTSTFPGRNPIGNLLFIGNMDRNRDDRCEGSPVDPCGTTAPIRYRNWKWGEN